MSDDGTEYTFKLREGVTFHNGDPFTAEDVVFTYNRSKDPEKSIQSTVISNVKDVVAVDDHTVKIVLGAPQASFLTKTLERSSGRAMTIVSRGALEELGTAQYGLTPVGTGPFRVTAHDLGQSVVLEKFEDYYDPERPKLDKVTITPIIDAEPLAAAVEAGDIQLIGGNPIAPEIVDRFLANPDLVVSIIPGPTFQSVWLNPWREPFVVSDFNKPLDELMQENGFKVRLAIAKALDRERYVEQAQFGRGTPAYGTINPAMGFFFDPGLAETSNQRFDLEEAKSLLAEAGYPDGEGFPTLKIIHTPDAAARGPGHRQHPQDQPRHRDFAGHARLPGADRRVRPHGLGPGAAGLRRRLRSGRRPGRLDADRLQVQRPRARQGQVCVRLLLRCQGRRADRPAAARDRSGAAQGHGAGGEQDHLRQGSEPRSCSTRWTSWSTTTR